MCGSVTIRVLFIFLLYKSVNSNEGNRTICYKAIGCFSTGYPWNNINGSTYYAPQSPDKIDTKFFLVTRDVNGSVRREIKHGEEIKPRYWTYVIIHGFYSSAFVDWITQMEQALIMKGDNNVISVDWSKGSQILNYQQAVSNTRVVAAELARLLKQLIKYNSVSPSKLHLIGHSLGAHLASYVGAEIPRLAQITGLDPSLPCFILRENLIRLDPGDADFVEVVHTNVGNFGHGDRLGHVDFYVNGGNFQPGCSMAEIKSRYKKGLMMEYLCCSHSRANYLYVEAIQSNCKFWGQPWVSLGAPNESQVCTDETCQIMGLRSSSLPGRGVFYVSTNPFPPYCMSDEAVETSEMPLLDQVPQAQTLETTISTQAIKMSLWTQVVNLFVNKVKSMFH